MPPCLISMTISTRDIPVYIRFVNGVSSPSYLPKMLLFLHLFRFGSPSKAHSIMLPSVAIPPSATLCEIHITCTSSFSTVSLLTRLAQISYICQPCFLLTVSKKHRAAGSASGPASVPFILPVSVSNVPPGNTVHPDFPAADSPACFSGCSGSGQ